MSLPIGPVYLALASRLPGATVLNSLILVFVVEDEPFIQSMVEDALRDGGYAVAIAANGEEAIRMIEGSDIEFRVIVTDINLTRGGVTGWDVARRARELSAEVPVIYMTGMDGKDWTSKGVPNSVLVVKPFAPAQLVTAVSQLLNQAAMPGA